MNCTQVAKNRKHDEQNKKKKTKSVEIDRSLCTKLYTIIKSLGPALLRPPFCGPSLISALAELVFTDRYESEEIIKR